jgi:hypothetical protein
MSRVAESVADCDVVEREDKEPLGVVELRLARPLGFGDRDFGLRCVIGGALYEDEFWCCWVRCDRPALCSFLVYT